MQREKKENVLNLCSISTFIIFLTTKHIYFTPEAYTDCRTTSMYVIWFPFYVLASPHGAFHHTWCRKKWKVKTTLKLDLRPGWTWSRHSSGASPDFWPVSRLQRSDIPTDWKDKESSVASWMVGFTPTLGENAATNACAAEYLARWRDCQPVWMELAHICLATDHFQYPTVWTEPIFLSLSMSLPPPFNPVGQSKRFQVWYLPVKKALKSGIMMSLLIKKLYAVR